MNFGGSLMCVTQVIQVIVLQSGVCALHTPSFKILR